ncbi:hypothetical protein KKC60_05090 [Patescibacteria group bacterium]|nr:hypothetical protein [Patescibacteria group bacterium]
MARYLTLTKSKSSKRGVRKSSFGQSVKTGPVTLVIATIALFCLLSFFFLAQVFQSSTKGYEVSELEKRIEDLDDENQKLEIQAAELKSLDNIERSVEEINMVPVQDVVYLEASTDTVVAAR